MNQERDGFNMAANFSKKDGFTYIAGQKVDKSAFSYLEMLFDNGVDIDSEDIKNEIKNSKIMKRVFFVKTLLFPLEYLMFRLFLDSTWAKDRVECQKTYWKFMRGKLTLSQVQKELYGHDKL